MLGVKYLMFQALSNWMQFFIFICSLKSKTDLWILANEKRKNPNMNKNLKKGKIHSIVFSDK